MKLNEDLLEESVSVALQSGAKEAIAKLIQKKEHQIRFSNSQIDVSKQWNQDELELFIAIGRRFSVKSIQTPTLDLIRKVVPQAVRIVKKLPKSLLYWGMEEEKQTYRPIPELYDDRIKEFSNKAPDLINETINASLEMGAKKTAGVLYFGRSLTGVRTGYDNGGTYQSSYYRLTVRSFVDPQSSGQDLTVGRDMTGIEDKFRATGKKAGEIAKMAEGGEQGKPDTYDLILTPTVAANIFNHILDGANPVYIIGRMSCLRGKMDEQIAPDTVNIADNATISAGLNSRPFDFEGVPSQETPLISDGKLVGLIQNTSSAKIWKWLHWLKLKFRQGFKTTGNSYLGGVVDADLGPKVLAPIPSNYVYEPGDYHLNEMIEESTHPTIYLTSNWYTRFTNFMEGRFSTIPRDGMFLIENGEIQKPIRNLRLTETLLGMLSRIQAIGQDQKQIMWWEVSTPSFLSTIKVKDCKMTKATD